MNSALTTKLLGHLHRIFDKDPARELALRFRYPGTMTWQIRDGILSTVVYPQMDMSLPLFLDGSWLLDGSEELDGVGCPGTSNLNIDLSQYTISELADYIASFGGYFVVYESSDYGSLSALVLLDGEGNQDHSNGDHFYAYTSLLWSYVSSLSSELADASLAIIEMLKQMSLRTAEGFWLDELGSYYKVPRILGESDMAYGPRIVAETLRSKGNNYAIAAAIEESTGVRTMVTDVDFALTSDVFLYDGAKNYDGTWRHSNTGESTLYDGSSLYDGSRFHSASQYGSAGAYGLFDVQVINSLVGNDSITAYVNSAVEQVNRLRDAGTFLRKITVLSAWYYSGAKNYDGTNTHGNRDLATEIF